MDDLPARIREALAAQADPVRAADQQRYMKSTMPYFGLTAPQLRAVLKPLLADRIADRTVWEATIRDIFDGATHREQWYAAIALLRHRHYRSWRDPQVMPLVEHLVTAGAWWDVVDDVSHVTAEVRLADPVGEAMRLRSWARADDFWLRRAAIIGQLLAKDRTDTALLTDVIDVNLDDREFFVRKAIGWALRDYARTDPEWVRAFLNDRGDRLSPLSRREAAKHL